MLFSADFHKKTVKKGSERRVTKLISWLTQLIKRPHPRKPLRQHLSQTPFLQVPTLPSNEADRVKALKQYNLLDTPPEEAFEELSRLAAYICGTPIALVSLIDTNRQWFKSKVGVQESEIPREISFCAHAIHNPDDLLVVPNALEDERFANNPLVTSDPNIRFYAGTPVVTPDGFPVGTLCVLDRIPRQLTPEQREALRTLGRQVITQMELRLNVTRLERQLSRHREAEAQQRASDQHVVDLLESMTDAFFALDRQWRFTYVNQKAGQILQAAPEELLGKVIWEALPKAVGSRFEHKYRQAVSQQKSVTFEAFYPSSNHWAEVRAFPSYDGLSVFLHDITARKLMEEALRYQQQQSDRLLLNILPAAIAERLKLTEETIADSFDEVTILFADLVNFTEIASKTSPIELVGLLNQIFSIFDQLTEKYGLEKIKTIGDAYMVVGGIPTPRNDHAEAIAEMALDMQSSLHQFNVVQGTDFNLRIGINTGSVVAGVIGTKKFTYDLWGDAVNTASRMESHGLADSIQITATTYERLQYKYILQERGLIQIKGKGEMKTYLLTGRLNTTADPSILNDLVNQ